MEAKSPTLPTISTERMPIDENALSDGEDSALSQMLDQFEQSQTSIIEPPPKVPKINKQQNPCNRMALNLSRFPFVSLKRPSKENSVPAPNQTTANDSKPEVEKTVQELIKSVRNRFLCTPSDDETSQPDRSNILPVKKTLSFFRKPTLVSQKSTLQQQNAIPAAKSNDSQPENDSAYDTMCLSSEPHLTTPPSILGSAAKTAKTPSIFPASEQSHKKEQEDEHDLSYLDTLEFGDADF